MNVQFSNFAKVWILFKWKELHPVAWIGHWDSIIKMTSLGLLLLGRFTALTGSYQRYVTAYLYYIQGSNSLKMLCRRFGKPIDPIFKRQTVLDCVTKVLGPTGCSEMSVTTNKRCVTSQNSESLIYTAAEVCSTQGLG
jgi:hypothetical protein